jgi:hypothetical protein
MRDVLGIVLGIVHRSVVCLCDTPTQGGNCLDRNEFDRCDGNELAEELTKVAQRFKGKINRSPLQES